MAVSFLSSCEKHDLLREKRREFFLERCVVTEISDTLVHGTPVRGLYDILIRDGAIIPQTHDEMRLDAFCVSNNDNMLTFFGETYDDSGRILTPNGLVFGVEKLLCAQLDYFHYKYLLGGLVDHRDDDCQSLEDDLAVELGYLTEDYIEVALSEGAILNILPGNIHGLIPPWGFSSSYNSENEISVIGKGCDFLMKSLRHVVIRGEDFEIEEARNKLNNEISN